MILFRSAAREGPWEKQFLLLAPREINEVGNDRKFGARLRRALSVSTSLPPHLAH